MKLTAEQINEAIKNNNLNELLDKNARELGEDDLASVSGGFSGPSQITCRHCGATVDITYADWTGIVCFYRCHQCDWTTVYEYGQFKLISGPNGEKL